MRISDWSSDVCSSDLYSALPAYRRDSPEPSWPKPMWANPDIQRRCARRFGGLAPKQGTHCPAAGSTNCDPPDVWPQFGVSGGLWRTGPQAKQDAPLRLGGISAPASISRQGARRRLPSLQYAGRRSEEHTSELQSLMRISYAVFCLKKKKQKNK